MHHQQAQHQHQVAVRPLQPQDRAAVARVGCARLLASCGFADAQGEALRDLELLMAHYLHGLAELIHSNAELNGRSRPSLQDVALGLAAFRISPGQLLRYARSASASASGSASASAPSSSTSTAPQPPHHPLSASLPPMVMPIAPPPTDAELAANPFFAKPLILTKPSAALLAANDPRSLAEPDIQRPKWLPPHLPPLPAPHSYLSTKVPMHADAENQHERAASVRQSQRMEANLNRLLLLDISLKTAAVDSKSSASATCLSASALASHRAVPAGASQRSAGPSEAEASEAVASEAVVATAATATATPPSASAAGQKRPRSSDTATGSAVSDLTSASAAQLAVATVAAFLPQSLLATLPASVLAAFEPVDFLAMKRMRR
ncbi:hypothetical protein BC831DRAFT_451032 [Entophlyctis helioformis]|nr:hypothetical protein BC831DRAFT_451032 [Entophlyctis helioformis]